MRLLLHVGMRKTGTSALQEALLECTAPLAEVGVLYPRPSIIRTNHNYLSGLYHRSPGAPRQLIDGGARDIETLRAISEECWANLEAELAESTADTVVLSGEYFLRIHRAGVAELAARLRAMFDEVRIACYLRDPADFYVSSMQQRVLASHVVDVPADFRMGLAPYLFAWAKEFPGFVGLRWFESDQLVGGDVISDFAATFLPQAADVLARATPRRSNQSISAEAMCLLQELRRDLWPDFRNRRRPESDLIRAVLRDLDEVDRPPRPSLVPGLREVIVHNNRVDIDFLRDLFGLEIPRRLEDMAEPTGEAPDAASSDDLRDILEVDPERLAGLRSRLVGGLAARLVAQRQSG